MRSSKQSDYQIMKYELYFWAFEKQNQAPVPLIRCMGSFMSANRLAYSHQMFLEKYSLVSLVICVRFSTIVIRPLWPQMNANKWMSVAQSHKYHAIAV